MNDLYDRVNIGGGSVTLTAAEFGSQLGDADEALITGTEAIP